MNVVYIAGSEATCSCGAVSTPGKLKRFLSRHPKLCNQKEKDLAFIKQLAQGTRSVVDDNWQHLSAEQKETVREMLRKK
jgi:hypothetical protein